MRAELTEKALVNNCIFKTVNGKREKQDDCKSTTCVNSGSYMPPKEWKKYGIYSSTPTIPTEPSLIVAHLF